MNTSHNIELRIKLNNTLQQNISGLMYEYNIPVSMMLDALNEASLGLKDLLIQELVMNAEQEQSTIESSEIMESSDTNEEE